MTQRPIPSSFFPGRRAVKGLRLYRGGVPVRRAVAPAVLLPLAVTVWWPGESLHRNEDVQQVQRFGKQRRQL